jgi:hypothetical protein
VDRDGVRRSIDAEDARPAGRRPDEIQQDPDGGGLARAVRAEESEDLALCHDQIDVDDSPKLAVRLGELLDLDDGGHVHPFM